jgi:hypothetical protein
VSPVAGWTIVAASTASLLVTVLGLRTRLAPPMVDAAVAAGGAGLGIGGLILVRDVEPGSWIVGPLAVALFAVVHVRALFAGSGPFRT